MVQRAECRPAVSENYMQLKRSVALPPPKCDTACLLTVAQSGSRVTEFVLLQFRLQMEESSKPVRLSQQLEKPVTTNYKPVSNHTYNVSLLNMHV